MVATYEFMGGKDFVEERVKADIKEKANMQLGRKEEISGNHMIQMSLRLGQELQKKKKDKLVS